MDMNPGEGTSDGRVRRKMSSAAVEIKQEPDIKTEPSDGLAICWVTRSNEKFEAVTATVTSNIESAGEPEYDIVLEFDSDGLKDEVKCEDEKPCQRKHSSANSGSNENEPNAHGGQYDEPMFESNDNRKRPKLSDKAKKCTIPRNKAEMKRTEHKCHVCGYVALYKYQLTAHIRIHTGEMPFKCDNCSNSLQTKI